MYMVALSIHVDLKTLLILLFIGYLHPQPRLPHSDCVIPPTPIKSVCVCVYQCAPHVCQSVVKQCVNN